VRTRAFVEARSELCHPPGVGLFSRIGLSIRLAVLVMAMGVAVNSCSSILDGVAWASGSNAEATRATPSPLAAVRAAAIRTIALRRAIERSSHIHRMAGPRAVYDGKSVATTGEFVLISDPSIPGTKDLVGVSIGKGIDLPLYVNVIVGVKAATTGFPPPPGYQASLLFDDGKGGHGTDVRGVSLSFDTRRKVSDYRIAPLDDLSGLPQAPTQRISGVVYYIDSPTAVESAFSRFFKEGMRIASH
jgi:hypothetical protein